MSSVHIPSHTNTVSPINSRLLKQTCMPALLVVVNRPVYSSLMLKTITSMQRIFEWIFNLSNASCSDPTFTNNLLILRKKICCGIFSSQYSYLVHETKIGGANCQYLLVIMFPCSCLQVENGPIMETLIFVLHRTAIYFKEWYSGIYFSVKGSLILSVSFHETES